MASSSKADISAGRLSSEELARNFSDLHPPLSEYEAKVAADRCYFCFDAPCVEACPTGIDIPGFIQRIRTGNIVGSAQTILESNILGGMCARVCPTETLCEEVCVRNTSEDQPVQIGRLQRFATDPVIDDNVQLFARGNSTGKRVAVVGAGPAGLSCAHRLSMLGHEVVIFERNAKPGGLNEYGIAAYKAVDNFAAREVEYVLGIGGIELRLGQSLGENITLEALRRDFDAVFLGIGLCDVNALGLENETTDGVVDAVEYIAALRQSSDKSAIEVGRRAVVIGGGMTAIDVAVQSRHLGADEVTIVYRRGKAQMNASEWEQDLAQTRGVKIMHCARPVGLLVDGGCVRGIELERTRVGSDGKMEGTGQTLRLAADMVFKAIGQKLVPVEDPSGSPLTREGRLAVNDALRTNLQNVWAGGDCIQGDKDLTVSAVEDGKRAAHSIHQHLTQ